MPYLLLNSRMILHRLSEWFPDSRNELVVVTAHSALAGTAADISGLAARFRHLAVVDDYRSPNLEQQVIRLCREHRVERLMTLGENDIVRAARLREALRLPGQELLSAIAYRDKFVMKTLAAAAGIRVAPMRLVTDGKMLRDFAGEVGLPVVVKPLDGGGGMGICVVHDGAALDTYTREWHHARLNFPRLAEAWVEGDFYQVNGLMHAGRVKWSWPSRNLHPDLATLTWGAPGLSGMLPREHPLFGPLLRATADTVAALPPAPEVRPLHAEFFHSADRGLVLCEIACRAGGGAIVETHERAFSVNLHEAGPQRAGWSSSENPFGERPCPAPRIRVVSAVGRHTDAPAGQLPLVVDGPLPRHRGAWSAVRTSPSPRPPRRTARLHPIWPGRGARTAPDTELVGPRRFLAAFGLPSDGAQTIHSRCAE